MNFFDSFFVNEWFHDYLIFFPHSINLSFNVTSLGIPKFIKFEEICNVESAGVSEFVAHDSSGSLISSSYFMSSSWSNFFPTHDALFTFWGPTTIQMTVHVIACTTANINPNIIIVSIFVNYISNWNVRILRTTYNKRLFHFLTYWLVYFRVCEK